MTISLDDILRLSVTERVRLVEDIWESIAANPESLPITDPQRRELDRRLEHLARVRSPLRSWDDVRARLQRGE